MGGEYKKGFNDATKIVNEKLARIWGTYGEKRDKVIDGKVRHFRKVGTMADMANLPFSRITSECGRRNVEVRVFKITKEHIEMYDFKEKYIFPLNSKVYFNPWMFDEGTFFVKHNNATDGFKYKVLATGHDIIKTAVKTDENMFENVKRPSEEISFI